MGWETSSDTLQEVILKFSTKEKAIEYAKSNNISYKIIEPKNKEFVIKSYADNFLKNKYVEEFFYRKKWLLWSWGGFAYHFISFGSNVYDVKINEWYKGFYDLLQST